jgi:predicted dehydrogenase
MANECEEREVKAVIIGAGRMGRRHIEVTRNVGLDLTGIADQSCDALAQAKTAANLTDDFVFEDARDMLREKRPECVVIATTAPSHFEYTELAVEAGARFVLCEKPMAVSLSECDRMLALCHEHGVALAVNHQMRFMEQYTQPKRLMESEQLGGLCSVSVVAGNFGLAMNGTHYFEMFRYMADEQPVEVSAWFSSEKVPNPRGAQFEDHGGVVRAVTASGKRFHMDASYDQGHGMQVTYAGRNGVLWIDELSGQMRVVARKAEHRALPTTRYGMPWEETSTRIEPAEVIKPSEAVLHALISGENYPSGDDGRLAVAVLVAAYVSDEHGGMPVRLDQDTLPLKRVFPWA